MPGNYKEYGGQSGVVKTEFNMGQYDYERLNDILRALADCFLNVRQNPDLLVKIYELLNEFYRVLRPLLVQEQRKTKDGELKDLKTIIFSEHNRLQASKQSYGASPGSINEKVLDEADAFNNALMDLRQIKGMGVKANVETSERQKIARAVRGQD